MVISQIWQVSDLLQAFDPTFFLSSRKEEKETYPFSAQWPPWAPCLLSWDRFSLWRFPLRNTFSCCRNSSVHHTGFIAAPRCGSFFPLSPDQMLHFWARLQAMSQISGQRSRWSVLTWTFFHTSPLSHRNSGATMQPTKGKWSQNTDLNGNWSPKLWIPS